MPCNWKLLSDAPVPDSIGTLAEELGITRVIAEVLWRRGYTSAQDMDRFLSPGLRHLLPPETIPGLTQAVAVLAREITQGATFCVWGDYDVDGITSTALVKDFLHKRLGPEVAPLDGSGQVRHFLPNRKEHGYGLSIPSIERLAAEGVQLLLTVDCGISSVAEVARANELGLTVVVSDHHLPPDELPAAAAICNPQLCQGKICQGNCTGLCDLAGVGVAFFLMAALNRLLPGEPVDMRQFLDLVALGTVADVVHLTAQNRILVKNGLLLIKEARRPGIASLKVYSGYDRLAELGAGQIGFGLAPRINAAGRMADPQIALTMLLAPDMDTANPLASKLDGLNAKRRSSEQEILEQALAQAEEQKDRLGLVLAGEDWHAGVIGIVASRVVERCYKPVLMLCREGEGEDAHWKGSGRSVAEFDLHEGLSGLEHLFLGFGGHKQAAGLSMALQNLDALREGFHLAVEAALGPVPLRPSLKLDRELGFGDISFTLLKELEMLQPFGMGNPEPLFVSPPVLVKTYRVFGKDHVKLGLAEQGTPESRGDRPGLLLPAKVWRKAAELTSAVQGKLMRFAFTPRIDRFDGIPKIELQVKDWDG
ncbi:MAG: single-stranded-DNA-specific exonuclease RecJ [Humidesulfovibrio sp.]|uniref:single-stranded-DNA-specific exonuclease RecJ n=1 Tax=Humidesulfovibrio sp. TaxID=2910988 RepID=UPI0027EEBD3B|nr:single-stranded-DNA-specific exonuclease RecJ [Humidesulfovibrio sp.]MDQ7834140.1 single-stranded-DNA-specific exonuclease RecJ [Humidesulfovibrio sp.]